MTYSRTISRLLGATGLLLLGACAAQGQGLSPTFLSVTPSGSNFDFSYELDLLDNTKIDNTSNVTFYDFAGLVGTPTFTSALSGASFVGSAPLLGVVPSSLGQTDNPTLANANLAFTGASPITNTTGSTINLGTIDIISSNGLVPGGLFTGYGITSFNAQNGSPAENNSFIQGPNTPANAPEPGTWALLVGSGVTGMVLIRRRLRIHR
ncbi:MAG TPA: PEP-CTERM sorting domain-containing protein [Chthonomonadaceae bacterium]|nr:PEP-CTERM sorting domain-containing protein [Chthonomonadaceae bacterium]